MADDPQARTISTQATARDDLPNGVADVMVAVQVRDRALEQVQSALSENVAKLIACLQQTGARRLRTKAMHVQPILGKAPEDGKPAPIVGHQGRITLIFEIDAERLGAALADALDQGASSIDSIGLRPNRTEVDAARRRLASEATRTALELARSVAEAAGCVTGPIVNIVVDNAAIDGRPPFRAAAAPAGARQSLSPAGGLVPIEPGSSEAAATVRVTVTLLER